jgi:hypothetical protein
MRTRSASRVSGVYRLTSTPMCVGKVQKVVVMRKHVGPIVLA